MKGEKLDDDVFATMLEAAKPEVEIFVISILYFSLSTESFLIVPVCTFVARTNREIDHLAVVEGGTKYALSRIESLAPETL